MPHFHNPVLLNEILALLEPKAGGVFLDATLGGGAHAAAVLDRTAPDGVLIGIDRDPEALDHARDRLKQYGGRAALIRGNFREVSSILASAGISEIDGAIADLGVSSHQLDTPRGFTFSRDEELDMRMSALENTADAAHIVNTYSQSDLADLIHAYGEERYARAIARAIVKRRESNPITRTGQLADIVVSAIPPKSRAGRIHPATRTFQAIRIEVNKELEAVELGIPAICEALKIGGRACVVSYHSLEDRLVKRTFRRLSGHCECPPEAPECRCGARPMLKVLTRKPVGPSDEEIENNPRSRSAKLRCAERIS